MQTGRDDRHVPERLKKTVSPLQQKKGLLGTLLKPRVLILVLVVLLLMLIFVMSLSVDKDDGSRSNASTKDAQRKEQTKKQAKDQKKNQNKENSTIASATEDGQRTTLSESNEIQSPKGAPIARKANETQYETGRKQTDLDDQIPGFNEPEIIDQPNVTISKADQKPTETAEKSDEKTNVVANAISNDKTESTKEKVDEKQAVAEKPVAVKKEEKNTAPKTEKKQTTTSNKLDKKPLIANDRFSIQLVGSTSLENVRKLITQYNIKNGHIYETIRNDKPWYVLIQGDYPSIETAREAIKSLPHEFQENKAWVKAGLRINKEMAMVPNQPN